MPKGFAGVRQASAELEARRGGGGHGALWFRLKPGEEAHVRFLEQDDDIHWCYVHDVPVEGRQFGRNVTCCDQDEDGTPCPGCERSLIRKFQGFINLIWNEAPIFKRDNDNKLVKDSVGDLVITGTKPQVAVWGSGIRLFEQFDEINVDYRGLTSRPFKVKRKGEKLKTKYTIAPADTDSGAIPMTEAEKELAANKFDLQEFIKAPSYDQFLKELGEKPGGANGQASSAPQARVNPFMRNK